MELGTIAIATRRAINDTQILLSNLLELQPTIESLSKTVQDQFAGTLLFSLVKSHNV